MLGAACQVDLMGMWPIARVNKPESDNPSILESVELATDSSGPSEEPIRRLIVHFAWERGHLRRNPAMSLVMTRGVVLAVAVGIIAMAVAGFNSEGARDATAAEYTKNSDVVVSEQRRARVGVRAAKRLGIEIPNEVIE